MDTPQTQIMHLTTASDDAFPENDTASGTEFGIAYAHTRTLDQLGKGEQAIVVAINPSLAFGSLDTLVTRRLWELGFLPGAEAQKILVTAKLATPNQKTVDK